MSRKQYPSDLTDKQWQLIQPLIPMKTGGKAGGRPPEIELREMLDAYFYLLRGGVSWRMLPEGFPAWQTVYSQVRRWKLDGTWERVHDRLRDECRLAEGRPTEPSAAALDSQSVKSADHPGIRGYDAGKKINGRKRHILVDTLGLLLAVVVTPASKQDRDGAKDVLLAAKGRFPRLRVAWADGGYAGKLIDWAKLVCGWLIVTILKAVGQKGFVVLPRRWVVERTFGWFMKYRRLVRDYETEPEMAETMIRAAMIHLMLRRLC